MCTMIAKTRMEYELNAFSTSSLFRGRSLLNVKRIFILLIDARIAAKNLGHSILLKDCFYGKISLFVSVMNEIR